MATIDDEDIDIGDTSSNNDEVSFHKSKLIYILIIIPLLMIVYFTPSYFLNIYKPLVLTDKTTSFHLYKAYIPEDPKLPDTMDPIKIKPVKQRFSNYFQPNPITDTYLPLETFSGYTGIQTNRVQESSDKISKVINNTSLEVCPNTIHNTLSLMDSNYGVKNETSTYAIPLQSLAYISNKIEDDPNFTSLSRYLGCMTKDECIINKIPLFSDRTSFGDGKKRDISIKTKTGFIGGENTGVLPENGPYSLSQFNIGVIGDYVAPLPDIVDLVTIVLSADTPLEHTYTMVQYIDAAYMSRDEPNKNAGYVILLVIPHALKQSLPAVQALFLSAPQIHIVVATEYRGDMAKAVNNIVKNFVSNDMVKGVNRVNNMRKSVNELLVSELALPLMTVNHVNVAMIHSNTPLTISDVLSKTTNTDQSQTSPSSVSPSMMVSVESVLYRLFRHQTNPTPISIIASANATCLSTHLSPSILPIFDTKNYVHKFTDKVDDVKIESLKDFKQTVNTKTISTIDTIGVDVSSLTPYDSLTPLGIALSANTQMICANAVISRLHFNTIHKQRLDDKSFIVLDYMLPYRLLPLPSAPPLHGSLADNIESTMKTKHNLLRKNYIVTSSLKQHMAHTWFPMTPVSTSSPASVSIDSNTIDLGLEYHVFNTTSVVDHVYTLPNSTSSLNKTADKPLKFLMPRSGSYVDGGVNTMNAAYDGYSTSCLVYYQDDNVGYHFVRQDQVNNTVPLVVDKNRHSVDNMSNVPINTYPSSVSEFLTKSGYPTWLEMISQYNTINKLFMNSVPSYSQSLNVIGRYKAGLTHSYDSFYTLTNDETAVSSIYSYLYFTSTIRIDHVLTPVVIDKDVCVMPSAYFDQFDTNPAININVAHNSFVNGYSIDTKNGPVLIAGLRQMFHAMDTNHNPQSISQDCTSLSSLAEWRHRHIATRTTVDEPAPPFDIENGGKLKNRINSPGTIKLAVLIPSRDNRSDDIIQVPFLNSNVMERCNKEADQKLMLTTLNTQRAAEEMEHKAKSSLQSPIFSQMAKMDQMYIPTMMSQNDRIPSLDNYTPSTVNGLFYEWAGAQKYAKRSKTLYQLGLDYHGLRDSVFYTKSKLNPSDIRTCSNHGTTNSKSNSSGDVENVVYLRNICQSTSTSSVLYSESTTRAELQMSPLGSIVESLKDTLLSIRQYYQHSPNAHQVGDEPMPFGSSIFHDVPLVEVTVYIGVDLYDKVWDNPYIMHKLRLITDLLIGDLPINIKLIHRVHGHRSAPNWIWGEIARTAYDEGNDYFLQINDDLTFHNKHWLLPLIYHYRNRPIPDFGVVGMEPAFTSRIFTQALFSYRYMEVMNGYTFPKFTNWHGDAFVTKLFSHYPRYSPGFITPVVFNNENGRYVGVSYTPTVVNNAATTQRYRFHKYLQIYFPDHPDTKEFLQQAEGSSIKKVQFYDSFLQVY